MDRSTPPHGHQQTDDDQREPDDEVPRAERDHEADLVAGQVVHHQPRQAQQHQAEHHRDVHRMGGAGDLHRRPGVRRRRVRGLPADLGLGHGATSR